MKKILWIFSCALLLSVAFFSTGCGDDATTDDLAPVVSIQTGPTPSSVVTDGVVSLTVTATKGTNPLKGLYIYEGSTLVDDADITIDGVADSNPKLLVDPQDSYTWDITVKVTGAAGTSNYSVKVDDTKGLSDEATFDVTVEEGLENSLTGVLLNAAGPAGTGAVDLETGISKGTSDASAELRDMGIDSLAGSGDNWRRRIGGVNGTEVRYVGNTNSGAEFAGVASKEAIIAAFDGGDDLITASTITTDHLNVWGNFKVSEIVQEGDVFAIYKSAANTYYLVEVTSVTETTGLGNNTDQYTLSIKY